MTVKRNLNKHKLLNSLVLALLVLLTGSIQALAQQAEHHQDSLVTKLDTANAMMDSQMSTMMPDHMTGMMKEDMEMMGHMMSDPQYRPAVLVNVLPTLKDSLGLSDAQVTELDQHVRRYTESSKLQRKQFEDANEVLLNLMTSGAPSDRVRTALHETATKRANLLALEYDTAAQMKALLTEEQRVQLSEIGPMDLHQHMTSNMSMMEMMQEMRGHGCMMQAGMKVMSRSWCKNE